MKFLHIFIPVAILHIVIIAVILLQPGCQVPPPPPPPVGAPEANDAAGMLAPSTSYRPTPIAPPAAINRQAPMRPVGSGVGTGSGGSDLPSAFNANLPLDERDPLLRPLESDEESMGLTAVEMEAYTIAPGDTLSRIARRFGVSIDSIREANALSGDRIAAGDTLMIPASEAASGASPAMDTGLDASGKAYTVVPGDNLTFIARRNNVSVAEIKRLNNLSSDTIKVGQVLYIPEPNTTFTPPPATPPAGPVARNDGTTYTVKPGETPITIARRLGISHRELMRANGITDPTRMKVGQVLIVPGAGTSAAPQRVAPPPNRPAVQPVNSTPPAATMPLRTQPTRPTVIDGTAMDPADLEAQMDDVPVSPVEIVEPVGSGG